MKYVYLLILILTFRTILGQSNASGGSLEIHVQDSLELPMIDIKESICDFYFRAYLPGQTIDIYSEDNLTFHGEIINSTLEYEEVLLNEEYTTKATRMYFENVPIDPAKAYCLALRILESGQLIVANENSVGNLIYLHCEGLKFEIKNEDKFIKQSFPCPWEAPNSSTIRTVILPNYDFIKFELDLDNVYNSFLEKLPSGKSYSHNGYKMFYKLTNTQLHLWEKGQPRREYLKTIKDSVDKFLLTALQNSEKNVDYFPCSEIFSLKFAKSGKLKSIEVEDYDKPSLLNNVGWYFGEKRELAHCKRKIRDVLNGIDLTAFNLEYEVERLIIINGNGEIILTDPIIY